MFAATRSQWGIVTQLLARSADPNATLISDSGHVLSTPLRTAADRGALEVVEQLLLAKAVVDLPMHQGRTALLSAATRGDYDVVRRLLSAKANVNARARVSTPEEETPLSAAARARNNDERVVGVLLDAKAAVNWDSDSHSGSVPGGGGLPPLAVSIGAHAIRVAQMLLAAKADVNAPQAQQQAAAAITAGRPPDMLVTLLQVV